MKTFFIIFLFAAILAVSFSGYSQTADQGLVVNIPAGLSLEEKLRMLPGVDIEKTGYDTAVFTHRYKLMITQPLDHDHPEKGTYKQKVYLNHRDENAPVVIYLDGYSVNSGLYISELAEMMDANYMHVEHRYFGESRPDNIPWEYLTIRQAAADHHRIIQLLKNIYVSKWVSTGISKGGQTAMFHRRFWFDDVDVTVPYVAPLNLAVADQRIYDFLDNAGTEECRKKIQNLQLYILKNREKTFPVFKENIEKFGFEFTHSLDTIFELSVFEFEFAFWQWGGNCNGLPSKIKKPEEAVNFLFRLGTVNFFEKNAMEDVFPFLYQAYTEEGLYGYRTGPFLKYLEAYKTDVDNYETFIPKDFKLVFDPAPMKDVNDWLKKNGNNMIYIYGELDAWSSTAFDPGPGTNALKIVRAGGSHNTRIRTLPDDQKELVLSTLEKWLEIKIDRD